jgi:hypothetical protein
MEGNIAEVDANCSASSFFDVTKLVFLKQIGLNGLKAVASNTLYRQFLN